MPGTGQMKRVSYDALAGMSYDAIVQLSALQQDFVVTANENKGRHIQRFIENDAAFHNSRKTLGDRLAFLLGSWHGFLLLDFLPLWNRAMLDGYEIRRIEPRGAAYEVWFSAQQVAGSGCTGNGAG